jgi:glycosyltransferase involved in cell wall biosynthesis
MRIGLTLQSLDPTWGGIGIYTEEIVKHLLKIDRKNEYVLLYPGFGAARKMLGRYQRKYKNALEIETDFSRIPSGLYWDQVVIPRMITRHGIDVVFNPFLSVPIRGRCKRVMIMHAVEYHTVPKVYDWKLYGKWFFLEKMLLPSADRLISISHTMTHDIIHHLKYPTERIRTIYHGVGEKFRLVEDEVILKEIVKEYLLPENFILFVGHLYPQKNFANLLRALHIIANDLPHDLVVAGRPRWKYEDDLSLIESLDLQERVHFLYLVPNDDLPAIYRLAACFICPSLYEAFGLALLEAMACGCPVVASRAGAIPEVSGGAALLFDPHNPEEMAAAIRSMVSDRELRQSYIEKGLGRAKEFTWDRCASETLQLLEEVAAR